MLELARFIAAHYSRAGASGPAPDPLAALSDDMSSGASLADNGWTLEDTSPTSTPTSTISGGVADLQIATGGTTGSLWFDIYDGALWHKEVDGACDMRARVRVTDSAGTGLPPFAQFRVGGIAAHDPDRSTYEYIHTGVGSLANGQHNIEWKSTDNSDSAFAGAATVLTGGQLLYDLRMVRRASDLQVFDLHYRAGTAEALESDTGWTLRQTIDRSDDTAPDRAANGGTSAVPLPSTLRWGLILYASAVVHNIRMFVSEVQFSTPSA